MIVRSIVPSGDRAAGTSKGYLLATRHMPWQGSEASRKGGVVNALSASSRRAIVGLVAVAFLAAASSSFAERRAGYDPHESGHPVKIAYYILYAVGFVIDILILRPAYWLGQREPFRTIFGVEAATMDEWDVARDPEIPPEATPEETPAD